MEQFRRSCPPRHPEEFDAPAVTQLHHVLGRSMHRQPRSSSHERSVGQSTNTVSKTSSPLPGSPRLTSLCIMVFMQMTPVNKVSPGATMSVAARRL